MRTLVLWFPRLASQLALRARPELGDRPLVFLDGAGAEALVAALSPAASACGILTGMTAGQARSRCPGAVFLPDNAAACLDELDRVSAILRQRATTLVAVEGRSHLSLDISALCVSPEAESPLAARLAGLAAAWSGFEVRAGVASTRTEAIDAARASRRLPVICPPVDTEDAPLASWREETLSVRQSFARERGALESRAALVRALARLTPLLAARAESYRHLRLTLHWPDESRHVDIETPSPLHTGGEAVPLLARRFGAAAIEGLTGLEVTLGRLGPDVRVRPCAANAPRRVPLHHPSAIPAPLAALRQAS